MPAKTTQMTTLRPRIGTRSPQDAAGHQQMNPTIPFRSHYLRGDARIGMRVV